MCQVLLLGIFDLLFPIVTPLRHSQSMSTCCCRNLSPHANFWHQFFNFHFPISNQNKSTCSAPLFMLLGAIDPQSLGALTIDAEYFEGDEGLLLSGQRKRPDHSRQTQIYKEPRSLCFCMYGFDFCIGGRVSFPHNSSSVLMFIGSQLDGGGGLPVPRCLTRAAPATLSIVKSRFCCQVPTRRGGCHPWQPSVCPPPPQAGSLLITHLCGSCQS